MASELKAVLQDIRAGAKVKNLDSLLNKLSKTTMIKTATRIYAGGDNLWKWYGHEYVKSQMRSMYKNVDDIAKWTEEITGRRFVRNNTFTGLKKTFEDALDEAAAWQIRNTYPTYYSNFIGDDFLTVELSLLISAVAGACGSYWWNYCLLLYFIS